jgi:hypothetical protein
MKRHRRPPRPTSRAEREAQRAHKEHENEKANELYDRLNPNADVTINVSKADCIKLLRSNTEQ